MNIDEIIMRASAIKLLANIGDKQAVFEECNRIIAICEAAQQGVQWTGCQRAPCKAKIRCGNPPLTQNRSTAPCGQRSFMSQEKLPNDPVLNAAYNTALEWAANWITGSQMLGHGEEVVEFAKNMAMSIRAAKREVGFQQNFFDAVRSDPYMPVAEKEYWLSQEGGRTQRAVDGATHVKKPNCGDRDCFECNPPRN